MILHAQLLMAVVIAGALANIPDNYKDITKGYSVGDQIGDSTLLVSNELLWEERKVKSASSGNVISVDLHKKLWPSGYIPYEIDTSARAFETQIREVMDTIQKHTCVKFVKVMQDSNWIKFVKTARYTKPETNELVLHNCSSFLGRRYDSKGPQQVSVGSCTKQKLLAVFLHLLGVMPKMFRKDKAKYITVIPANIKGSSHPLDIIFHTSNSKTPFDYFSPDSMHPNEFGKDKLTYYAIGDPKNTLNVGPKTELTELNINEINVLYECLTECSSPVGLSFGGSMPDKNFSASSSYKHFTALNGRLNGCTAWCSKTKNRSIASHLEIDLGKPTQLCSIAIQGNGNDELDAMLLSFVIRYANTTNFGQIRDIKTGNEKVFNNKGHNRLATERHKFPVINGRYFVVGAVNWNERPCMRIEFYKDPTIRTTEWSNWSPCRPQDCKQTRHRFCGYIDKKNKFCPKAFDNGTLTEIRNCSETSRCTGKIDGEWGTWSSWSNCNKACGFGKQTRTRQCIYPVEQRKGKRCVGKRLDERTCRATICPFGPDGCGFTYNFCAWSNDPVSQFAWTRISGKDKTSPSGQDGYFVTFKHPLNVSTFSDFRSAVQGASSKGRCLKFYYFLESDPTGDGIEIFTENPSSGTKIKTLTANLAAPGKFWRKHEIVLDDSNEYRVVFRASKGNLVFGIDEIQLTIGLCTAPDKTQSASQPSILETEETCDFTHDLCTWESKKTTANNFVNLLWTKNSGETNTSLTGPMGDHTNMLGSYLYTEASPPNKFKDRARLESRTYTKDFKCLAFWLNMNGEDVWQLNVYKQTDSPKYQDRVFKANYNTRSKWWKALVNLEGTADFKIIIEGLVGPGELGDIAIDDVTVSRKTCNTTNILEVYPEFQTYALERDPSGDHTKVIFDFGDLEGPNQFETAITSKGVPAGNFYSLHYFQFKKRNVREKEKAMMFFDGIKDNFKGCLKFFVRFGETRTNSTVGVYQRSPSNPKLQLLKSIQNQKLDTELAVLLDGVGKRKQIVFQAMALKPGNISILFGPVKLENGPCPH